MRSSAKVRAQLHDVKLVLHSWILASLAVGILCAAEAPTSKLFVGAAIAFLIPVPAILFLLLLVAIGGGGGR